MHHPVLKAEDNEIDSIHKILTSLINVAFYYLHIWNFHSNPLNYRTQRQDIHFTCSSNASGRQIP